jgi:putative SOS response-associated peptidase YedK
VFIVIATSYARPVVKTLPPRWTGRGALAQTKGGQKKYLGPKTLLNLCFTVAHTAAAIALEWALDEEEMKLATFNARVETVADKPMFRSAYNRTRRLMPVSGYYEWQDTPEGKQPHYFTRRDGHPITIAGLWDEWHDKSTGEKLKSCAMVITEPNNKMRSFSYAI